VAPEAGPDATEAVVGLARTVRAAGVPVTPDRVQALLGALDVLDPTRRDHVYWAGRLTLLGDAEHLLRYDRAFDAWFRGDRPPPPRRVGVTPARLPVTAAVGGDAPDPAGAGETGPAVAVASPVELLRQRDVATLTIADREALRRLLAAFRLPGEVRRVRRLRPAPRGRIDPARTLRDTLRRAGETVELRRRDRAEKPRRVVLIVDVSGSMAPYADALLRFAHAAAHSRAARTEVFTIGTRLTRVSREMSHRDPDTAMAAVAAAVPDWQGGTRLGELLRAFLDRWGQRGMARGAVVVVLSDGWERGDAALLGAQMQRLSRLAHRVVWANPLKSRAGYAPVAAGMAAALPHVDDFVEGHSLAALERLAEVVAGA
jgi:uncharacterized protein with von Willebrand factor type A (vWA) domain